MAKVELVFTGHFVLNLEYEGLEAVLEFKSGTPLDRKWTWDDIQGLGQTAGVVFGHMPDDVHKALTNYLQKKESQFTVLWAKGLAPVSTVAEEIDVVDNPIPEEWRDAVHEVLAYAEKPRVQKEVQTKIEREKTVMVKGALPFMPTKEERVKVVEKATSLVDVPIDTRVLSLAFVEEGARIAQVQPAKNGTPGKSVRGEVMQPPSPPDTTVYPGGNVSRRGAELISMVTGIARIGSNWVDVLPFAPHKISLSVSDDKATLWCDYQPGAASLPLPSYSAMLEAAAGLGFEPNALIPEHDFNDMIRSALHDGSGLQKRPLTLPEDSFFDVTISEDNLKAVLNVSKGSGHGRQLVLKEVGKAINESGIKLTDREKVKKDVLDFFSSSDKALIGYVLAEGKVPEAPPPQAMAWTLEVLDKKEGESVKALLAANRPVGLEQFDFSRLTSLSWVQKEQRIANLGPSIVGPPGVDVMGRVIPGIQTPALKVELMGPIEQSAGFFVAKIKGLVLKAEREDGLVQLALVEHMDAMFKIQVASDGMTASISVDGHRGSGKPLDSAAVKAELQKAGIKKGLLEDVLTRALEEAVKGSDLVNVCIARGKAAKEQVASPVEWLLARASGQAVRFRADGTADYKNKDLITTVKKDTPILRILPPEQLAENGYDIFGKEIKPQPVSGAGIEAGQNVRSEGQADKSVLFLANVDGELKHDKGRVEIIAGYTLKGHVDSASGNIKFPGPVTVAGDVLSGFYVMAGGDIKVAGTVEAALLSSEQDIMIAAGVRGGHRALLRSKRHVMANFIEHATVLAIGDVKVKKSILKSTIKCNSRVILADDASVIGGEIKVKSGLQVGNLGNENSVPTKVVFGADILVEDQVSVEEKEIVKLQEQIAGINATMRHPEKISDKAIMQDLFNKKVACLKMLEKRNLRLFALKERLEQHFPSEVIIKGTVFPGVVIECHGRTMEIHSKKNKVRIGFDTSSGKLVETSLEAKQ